MDLSKEELNDHYEKSRSNYNIQGESHLEYYRNKFPDHYSQLKEHTMGCKNCPSEESLLDNDPLYSSYLCLDCGYYYREEESKEIELIPYCLFILDDTHYETIESRKILLTVLRTLRKSSREFKVTLKRYSKGQFQVKNLII